MAENANRPGIRIESTSEPKGPSEKQVGEQTQRPKLILEELEARAVPTPPNPV